MKRPLVFALVLALSGTVAWADRNSDCAQNKDLDRQISGWTQIIERGKQESQKNRAQAFTNRGKAHYLKGEFDRAIADLTSAITLNPKEAIAYYNRGNAYADMLQVDRAIADYTQAIALNPSDAGTYTNRGRAYSAKGEVDRAIADFDKAITLNPKEVLAYSNRSLAYTMKRKAAEVEADLLRHSRNPTAPLRISPRPSCSARTMPTPTVTEASPTGRKARSTGPSLTSQRLLR